MKEKEVEYRLSATRKDFNRAKITKSKDVAEYARQLKEVHEEIINEIE